MTVAKLLGIDEMKFLYDEIGLESRDVEKAETEANTTKPTLKARRVLLEWRKIKRHSATRESVLEALNKCGSIKAMDELQQTWF